MTSDEARHWACAYEHAWEALVEYGDDGRRLCDGWMVSPWWPYVERLMARLRRRSDEYHEKAERLREAGL